MIMTILPTLIKCAVGQLIHKTLNSASPRKKSRSPIWRSILELVRTHFSEKIPSENSEIAGSPRR